VPYSHQLTYFRAHLQQLDMESNGKCAAQQGVFIDYATGPIVWGEHGCNGQHAFHQLLHQGQHLVPVDFVLVGKNNTRFADNQDILIASGLSQAQALLHGKTYSQALKELQTQDYAEKETKILASHKAIPGNRPSNTVFMKDITPRNLGALLALYEHKIFVQVIIWNINSFDQWGVELGKQLLPSILHDLKNFEATSEHDASTMGLIEHYNKLKNSL
jgi:glucose-6-phosphate isomerase